MSFIANSAPDSLRSNPAALTAFIGLHLQQSTETLYKLKMETAGKPLSKRDILRIDTLEQSIASLKWWLKQVRAQAPDAAVVTALVTLAPMAAM
jgi:hypothetical protein